MPEMDDALVGRVADRLLRHPFTAWFYGDSIGFEGLLSASRMTGEARWADFAHGFLRGWAARRLPFGPDDNTAPGLVLCELAQERGDELLREAALDLAQRLRGRRHVGAVAVTFEDTLRSLRQPYGGSELGPDDAALMKDPGAGVWLDCMHFDAPFHARLAGLDPAGGWTAVAEREILAHRDLLRDPSTGLYRHYWLERTDEARIPGWGRGQGWALLGLLDVAHLTGSEAVAAEALALARAMLPHQLPDGHWHAMVHEPRSGPESSTAAFMSCAFHRGMARGLLPAAEFEGPAGRAHAAMEGALDSEGRLTGVSAAVMAALVEEHYWHVPRGRIVPWGQGPALAAEEARRDWVGRATGPRRATGRPG